MVSVPGGLFHPKIPSESEKGTPIENVQLTPSQTPKLKQENLESDSDSTIASPQEVISKSRQATL
jgi:hypothetical protein